MWFHKSVHSTGVSLDEASVCWTFIPFELPIHPTTMVHGVSSLMPTSVQIWCSLIGAERPKNWGGSSQNLGRIDRVWGGRGADRLWGGSSVSPYWLATGHVFIAYTFDVSISKPHTVCFCICCISNCFIALCCNRFHVLVFNVIFQENHLNFFSSDLKVSIYVSDVFFNFYTVFTLANN